MEIITQALELISESLSNLHNLVLINRNIGVKNDIRLGSVDQEIEKLQQRLAKVEKRLEDQDRINEEIEVNAVHRHHLGVDRDFDYW